MGAEMLDAVSSDQIGRYFFHRQIENKGKSPHER
jgi:hypothetical protein